MNKAERMQIFADALKGLGYSPELDEDGDLVFAAPQGEFNRTCVLYVLADETDEMFAALGYLHFWSLDSKEELQKAFITASKVNEKFKALKIFIPRDRHVDAMVEMIGTPEQIATSLDRAIQTLAIGVTHFAVNMVFG